MNEIRTHNTIIHGLGGKRNEIYVNIQDYVNMYRIMQVKFLKEKQTDFIKGQLDMVEQNICDLELIEKLALEK